MRSLNPAEQVRYFRSTGILLNGSQVRIVHGPIGGSSYSTVPVGSIKMMDTIPDGELQSVDLNAGSAQWALMALNPSGERQLMVKELGSGHQSTAVLLRELEGDKLSVLKVNNAAHIKERMARPDREVRVARLLASSGGAAARFARLLSSQDLLGGYRTSWWEFYNVGSMQDFSMFVFAEATPPLSLVFRVMSQCLEGIQCLNELDIRHMDLHTGNVFVHQADGASHLDAVIGDFGYSRLPGEGPPEYTAREWSMMDPKDQAGRSSPPLTYGDRNGNKDDPSWRLRWDLRKFQSEMTEDLLDNFDKDDDRNQLIFSLFQTLTDMCEQDEKDRKLPEARRPPLQDLTQTIQDAKTLERMYASTDSDRQALRELLAKLLELRNEEPLEPLVFDNERAARDEFKSLLEVEPFRMVNLADEKSIEAATAEIAALRVEGSVYVSSYSDQSGSSADDSTSPASSQTRDSTPAGESEQQDSEKDNDERRNPSTSSRESTPSIRWTPPTRGLAEATAFAGGDVSAVDGLLGARDAAERNQALVRDEHARRRRGLWVNGLLRRRE